MFDMNYMAGNPNKDIIGSFISSMHEFYFLDIKEPRTELVEYLEHGSVNESLINICFFLSEIIDLHLKSLDYVNDKAQLKNIFEQFYILFKLIAQKF